MSEDFPKVLSRFSSFGRSGLSSHFIRVHPQPKKEELFSSWFARMSIANLSIPQSFASVYFGEYLNCILNDPDWGTLRLYEEVAKRVNFPFEKIFNLSLRTYEGLLFEDPGIYNNCKPFINPVKPVGGRFRKHGLRYCPECLKEDNYFRKLWRITFYTACLKHKVFLLDRCPECGSPVTPLKWKLSVNHFHCFVCGFDFREASSEKVPIESEGLEVISHFLNVLDSGYFEFGGSKYYSIFYFKVIEHFLKVIYFMKRRNSKYLKREEELVKIRLSNRPRTKYYYDIPLKELYVIFTAVGKILRNQEELEKFIIENKLKKTELTKDFKSYPYWYSIIVDKYDNTFYKPSLQEIINVWNYLKKTQTNVSINELKKWIGKDFNLKKRKDLKLILNV